MQIVGIYLERGDPRVIKNLTPGWYSFGNISDCSKIFNHYGEINENEYFKIKNEIIQNHEFINRLYKIKTADDDEINEKISNPLININCIVGKNGSGKSSLVSLEYRIINNFACVIKLYCPLISKDYKLTWASGFEASLYYELNDEIYCIKINNNIDFKFSESQEYGKEKIKLYGKNIHFKEICESIFKINKNYLIEDEALDVSFQQSKKLLNYFDEIKKPLNELSQHLFYTIGVNYSLYSNTVVYDTWNNKKERWLSNIYHKNDAYFTPIVLVPYKYNGSEINVDKELSLAKERISTLSLLLFSENKSDFIENLIPSTIEFSLISEDEYDLLIKRKYIHSFADELYSDDEKKINKYYKEVEKNYNLTNIIPIIDKIWIQKLFSKDKEIIINNDTQIYKIIRNNTLKYLTYKTIKICIFYDDYKKYFDKDGFVKSSKSSPVFFEKYLNIIISSFFTKDVHLDFINLKIMQCIKFLSNIEFYMYKSFPVKKESSTDIFHRFIYSNDFLEAFPKNNSYDKIFINLPSAIFRKEFFYKEKKYINIKSRQNERSQSVLSSGESQLLNSLSYVVYHMKNAASNQTVDGRIQYKNFNLVLDEAELYYHPEFQQKFVKDLLGVIGRSNLGDIVDSINITLITHSPFMLSDIPTENVLALEYGSINNDFSKTLGANIYDLLKNQFFMESAIGSLIEEKIIEIIQDYNLFNESNEDVRNKIIIKYTVNKTFYNRLLSDISDAYFKSLLEDIYSVFYKEDNIDDEIAKQEKLLFELKEKKRLQDHEKNVLSD